MQVTYLEGPPRRHWEGHGARLQLALWWELPTPPSPDTRPLTSNDRMEPPVRCVPSRLHLWVCLTATCAEFCPLHILYHSLYMAS